MSGHEIADPPAKRVKWKLPRNHVLTPYITQAIAEERNDVALWLLEKAGIEGTESSLVVPEESDEDGSQRGRLVLSVPPPSGD